MIKNETRKKKVLVAMSGGVDSSVAAYLLKEQGYDILGLTMQICPEDSAFTEAEAGCSKPSAVEDARSVCQSLGIPFYVLDFRNVFEESVIDYFISEYLHGRTPNPCIVCNQLVKFSALLKKAQSLGADYIATGHYAKVSYDQIKQRYLLGKAKDLSKDQSYVLYSLTQQQLAKTLMPLGSYTKLEVRKLADSIGLKVANKPESQDICFIPDNDYRNFLKSRVKDFRKGDFLDTKGEVIGTHQGIPFYTIGQRKGLGLALGYPAYVVELIPEKNTVVLGKKDDLFSLGLSATSNNFISIDSLRHPMKAEVKIRYKSQAVPAIISPADAGNVKVAFENPAKAITPGQAVVYYEGDLVIGGGTITKKF
jgi:tRNA-specific 2-thiouridylase